MSRQALENLIAQAYEAHRAGRHDDAERFYKRVLRRDPGDSEARNLLGLLFLQQQRFAEAAQEIRRALAHRPGNPESLYNLGAALLGSGDPNEAARLFRKVISGDPGNEAARQALSVALNDSGTLCNSPGEAMKLHAEALDVNPSNAQAAINLGILQEQTGDPASAATSFQQAIKSKLDFVDAHFHLAHLKEHPSSNDDISAMVELYSKSEDPLRALLAHGIAKALEKQQRYAEEFEWLTKAHKLKQSLEPYDEDRTIEFFRALQTKTSNDFAAGNRGKELVFIVGMPRSGTTLAEQILASHPEIHGAGEVMALRDIVVSPQTPAGELTKLASIVDARIKATATDASLFVETTPANFLLLGKIALLFPSAKIVHCVRDPLDTCLSIYQHPLSESHAYAHDLERLGRYYLLYQNLMKHWHRVLPNPIFDFKYESVVGNLDASVRHLLAFCGMEFDPRCLSFHETKRQIRTPSASQVRTPIYTSSLGRWQRYADGLKPLRNILAPE